MSEHGLTEVGYTGLSQMLNITVNEDLSCHVINEDETLEFFLPPHNVLTTKPFTSAQEVEEFVNSNVDKYNWWQDYVDPAVREQKRLEGVAEEGRRKRNTLLADTDWTQMNDSPLTNELKTAWATYRQELRGVTDLDAWPNLADDDWPVQP